jgi:tRNA threonylcarbamoyladenosine biosynthesis protein TsaB
MSIDLTQPISFPLARSLAIETSGRVGSIAIAQNNHLIAEETFPHGLAHAAQVLPIIDRLTRAAGWLPADVQALYVSIGPGSFTGLRIAVTLAKTMALATGVKIVAVPSVRVLVENAPDDARNVVIVLDAKRGQIFTASFSRVACDARWTETAPARVDTLQNAIDQSPKPVYLLGEGIPYHEKYIPNRGDIFLTEESIWRARAAVVAKLGAEMAARGEFADPWKLTPIYIRLPEAEEKWRAATKTNQHEK